MDIQSFNTGWQKWHYKIEHKQTFWNNTMKIPLSTLTLEVEGLLNQLFKLCHNRKRADQIVDVFDFE